eukprot:TRINITY_DN50004_c0_g1_i1.p1 TRINITY_DN50004_c0_g1~~TRINITY_DN50004_c0_g1_i1.p1  ORF type:complete len:1103 (+),score=139.20 TRINITY_DN50004_c0_g1_i1:191-3499(+)
MQDGHYGPSSAVAGDHFRSSGQVDWHDFTPVIIVIPSAIQILIWMSTSLFRRLYSLGSVHYVLEPCVLNVVGTEDIPPKHPHFLVAVNLCQLVFSFASVVAWVLRSHPPHTLSPHVQACERITVYFFALHYVVNLLQAEFSSKSCWRAAAVIDVFTIVPRLISPSIVLRFQTKPMWLRLEFLRALRLVIAFQRLEVLGFLRRFGDLEQAVVLMFLRLVALLITMGGTVFVLEVLGEVPFLQEEPVSTAMGDLSFSQMCYWVMTTISTVGYGDYAPRTSLSRVFTCTFIVSGVMFFSSETNRLLKLSHMLANGQGCVPSNISNHIVVIGSCVGKRGSLTEVLLQELLHSAHDVRAGGAGWPHIVVLSEQQIDQALRTFVTSTFPRRAADLVTLLTGNALDPSDLERARVGESAFVYLLPDTKAEVAEGEDDLSISRVFALKETHPGVRVRLLLLLPESKMAATSVGIKSERSLSLGEVKAAALGVSCRVHGFVPLLANLFTSNTDVQRQAQVDADNDPNWFSPPADSEVPFLDLDESAKLHCSSAELGEQKPAHGPGSKALREYLVGAGHQVLGFALGDPRMFQTLCWKGSASSPPSLPNVRNLMGGSATSVDTVLYSDLAVLAFQRFGVIVLGMQDRGRLKLAPMDCILKESDIVFCIARERSQLETLQHPTADWRKLFIQNREEALYAGDYAARVGRATLDPHLLGTSRSGCFNEGGEARKDSIAEDRDSPRLDVRAHTAGTNGSSSALFLPQFQLERAPTQRLDGGAGRWKSTIFDKRISLSDDLEDKDTDVLGEKQRVEKYRADPGCITVLICGRPQWDQVSCFLKTLRTTHARNKQPVIVLSSRSPPKSLSDMSDTAFLTGSVRSAACLLDAGILDSGCIVLLQGKPLYDDGITVGLIEANLVEHILHGNRPGWRMPFVMYEFRSDRSVGLMSEIFQPLSNEPVPMRPRYMGGSVVTPECLEKIIGQMYYLPATLELIEAFCIPDRSGQTSIVWQTKIPPGFVGKVMGDLLDAGTRGTWRGLSSSPRCSLGLPLALYRVEEGNALDVRGRYLRTCPSPEVTLRGSDEVIWLGTAYFGDEMRKEGLLMPVSYESVGEER